jgi:hypothetical protein
MKYLVTCILICGSLPGALTPAWGETWKAWFEARQSGAILAVTAYCRGEKEGKIRYRMEASKRGPSGTSNSVQSGAAKVIPDEPAEFSRITLGIHPGDCYTIRLTLFEGGTRVAEEILVYPQEK